MKPPSQSPCTPSASQTSIPTTPWPHSPVSPTSTHYRHQTSMGAPAPSILQPPNVLTPLCSQQHLGDTTPQTSMGALASGDGGVP